MRQPENLASQLLGLVTPALLGVLSLGQILTSPGRISLAVGLFMLLIAFVIWWQHGAVIAKRRLASRHYVGRTLSKGSQLGGSVIARAGSYGDLQVIEQGTDWDLYDYLYQREGQNKAVVQCYTVFEAALPRITPHLVFDAKRAHGRQFRSLFVQAQKISLEGNFDQYFDVYVPDHYVIDSMSFLSPEVMDAFMTLKEFDAELVNDRLLVYAPLLAEAELKAFQADCAELTRQLHDNLSRYRDSYLPSRDAKKHVAPFARLLLENPWRQNLVGLLFGAVATGVIFGFAIVGHDSKAFYTPYSFMAYAILIGYSARVAFGYYRNAQKKRAFYSDVRFVQQRGRY